MRFAGLASVERIVKRAAGQGFVRLQTCGAVLALAMLAGCATSEDFTATASIAADDVAAGADVAAGDAAAAAGAADGEASEIAGVTADDAAAALAEAPVAAAAIADGGGEYRIGALDVLDISVFNVPDLSKEAQVNSKGEVSLPLIGAVMAAGKTTAELETDIAAKLGAEYLQSPQVSVAVTEYTSQQITVDGAVNQPGVFATTGRTTLLRAIALAQGLDRVADPRGIVVFRTVDGARQVATFDLAAIRAGTAEDPVVRGGDIIVVDQSGGRTAMRAIRESVGVFGLFMPFL